MRFEGEYERFNQKEFEGRYECYNDVHRPVDDALGGVEFHKWETGKWEEHCRLIGQDIVINMDDVVKVKNKPGEKNKIRYPKQKPQKEIRLWV